MDKDTATLLAQTWGDQIAQTHGLLSFGPFELFNFTGPLADAEMRFCVGNDVKPGDAPAVIERLVDMYPGGPFAEWERDGQAITSAKPVVQDVAGRAGFTVSIDIQPIR